MIFFIYFLFVLSIIISLGGAVNTGFSGVFLALPFMIFLVYTSYKKSKYLFAGIILFIFFCFVVNKTQDSNYLIYPILKDGTATVLQDGYQHTFLQDGSGSFDTSSTTLSCTGCGEERVTHLNAGEVYKVIGVHHENGDFADRVGVITEIGQFSSSNTDQVNKGHVINLNKPIQSKWSKLLGALMYWPMFPFFAIALFNK